MTRTAGLGPEFLPAVPRGSDPEFEAEIAAFRAEHGWEPIGTSRRTAHYWWMRGKRQSVLCSEAERADANCTPEKG